MSLVATGFSVGLETVDGIMYDPRAPYRACLICGVVFQPTLNTPRARQEWAISHGKEHTAKEHVDLRKSGRLCTPEAALRLAAFGLIDVTGLIMDDELKSAYREAPRLPVEAVRNG